ncbi:methyl-accepting chemotaxis protein [Vibrio hannami]|uniref:methyl-accepting chemotaxis protein n=1 Tax=Vibrio hannami TaxID=2717094 RepID=UPI0024106541|nr:methyl-accepting chemotaxis protein [Vibrio hannami]MDG3087937.1 methyl-accepting chemotaxis protein [Vibrio hannami]
MSQLFYNLSIKSKMIALVAILLSLMLAIAGFGYTQMQRISIELQSIIDEDMPLTEITTSVTTKQLEGAILLEKSLRSVGLTGGLENQGTGLLINQFKIINSEIDKELIKAENILAKAIQHSNSTNLYQEIASLQTALVSLKKEHTAYMSRANGVVALIESTNLDEANQQLGDLEHFQNGLNKHLEEFLKGIEKLTEHALIQTEEHEKTAVKGMVIIGIVDLVIGILLGTLFTTALTKSIGKAVKASNQLAKGDLRVELKSDANDETGQLLNAMDSMASTLNGTIRQILNSSGQIASLAEEMAAASEQTNHAIGTQQLNTEHVVTAMTEMSTTIQQVADSAIRTSSTTSSASKEADVGNELVASNQKQIEQLVMQIQDAAGQVKSVDEESHAIDQFVVNINEIAEQTNLLALNAAIEAARAGEQGRGFAVVADEVRHLAQRTQQTTTQIHRLIEALQSKTGSAVSVIEQSSHMVSESAKNAESASQSILSISQSVEEIDGMTMEIAAICEQQSAAAEEINQSVIDITHSGTEVLGSSEHTARSSEELATLAAELRNLMKQFQVKSA